ncbi:MAG: hypothetical protein OQL06_09035 [Gammaproteobacteria bacterium]|nr:hypothetical protein [Gammaproteobacteria bacterium]
MPNIKKIVLAAVLAGSTALISVPANAFWGPFDWFDDGPGWGGPWGGYPGYGYGGYPGYGWGGYPGYGYGGYPYATPLVPTVPAPATTN